ncbi:glucosaminidase domain-containing protein [Marinoscillum furvescens]|nr:glucosaminidase domain-containing protein [Marinoscillum furvescens]
MKFLKLGVILLLVGCREYVTVLETETVIPNSPKEIVSVTDSLVKPVLYQQLPSFESLPVDESKEKFISAVLPAVLIARYRIAAERERVLGLLAQDKWSPSDSTYLSQLQERFGGAHPSELPDRMLTHPSSIVLAQAAVESGWGSSRFFREGNNLFGIWSYDADEPRMPASLAREDQNVYLRKYEDVAASIQDYFETMARARPYRHFRAARAETQQVQQLLPHLKYYSERRMAYVDQLQTIIRQNDLTRYDAFRIDPKYFVKKPK